MPLRSSQFCERNTKINTRYILEQTAISGGVGLLIIFVFTEDILNKHSLLGYVCMLPFNVNIVTLQKIFIFTKIIRKDLYIVSLDIFL